MEDLGNKLAGVCPRGSVIFLQGELGAGKTTWVRGYLRGLGYAGNVKSPTYTLVEPYTINDYQIYHFDLYRIANPDELESIGPRDYLDGQSICLIEWPERAGQQFPVPDLRITIEFLAESRRVNLEATTPRGQVSLDQLSATPA